jgi:hypothetical protein
MTGPTETGEYVPLHFKASALQFSCDALIVTYVMLGLFRFDASSNSYYSIKFRLEDLLLTPEIPL